jgi:hypothetical protein
MFKIGDRVKLVRGGILGHEVMPWWEKSGLKMNDEYIIQDIINNEVLIYNHVYWHYYDHFELVDKLYEYKVKLSQEEVDALTIVCPVIGGSIRTTSRSVFNTNTLNKTLVECSSFDNDMDVCNIAYRYNGLNFNMKV